MKTSPAKEAPVATNFLTMSSPVGPALLVAEGDFLVAVLLEKEKTSAREKFPGFKERATPVLQETRRQLEEYFAGRRRNFELPLRPRGTDFQRAVWSALREIPFGETRTYAQQAAAIRRPKAVRAVGAANGRNPLWIVVPCHRVIGKDGSLTGYAGGLDVKKYLLALESKEV